MKLNELKNNPECPICMEDFKKNEEVYLLSCYHIFHKTCATQCFKLKMQCPECRDEKIFNKSGSKLRDVRLELYKNERLKRLKTKRLSELSSHEIKYRLIELNINLVGHYEKKELYKILKEHDKIKLCDKFEENVDISELSNKDLKLLAAQLGVSIVGIYEKHELIELLKSKCKLQ